MIPTYVVTHARRITLAALRLALLYALSAILLVVLAIMLLDGPGELTMAARDLLRPTLFIFGVTFFLLALARRAGFILPWFLLLGLWFRETTPPSQTFMPENFLLWTALTVPLYAIALAGMGRRVTFQVGNASFSLGRVVGSVWAALTAVAVYYAMAGGYRYEPHTSMRAMSEAAGVVFWLAPVAISLVAVAHVWRGLRPANSTQRMPH